MHLDIGCWKGCGKTLAHSALGLSQGMAGQSLEWSRGDAYHLSQLVENSHALDLPQEITPLAKNRALQGHAHDCITIDVTLSLYSDELPPPVDDSQSRTGVACLDCHESH